MAERPAVYPVILSGGSGTRLWPLSRKSYPKQFGRIIGEESLFQKTVRRFMNKECEKPVIVTGDSTRFIVIEQLANIEADASTILIEPEGRNTAAAILAAALWIERTNPDALMIVAPSDQTIEDAQSFCQTVMAAVPRAQTGDLVTFGIKPDRPETGFGYLELAQGADINGTSPQNLASFVEKPDHDRALSMIESGRYLWNAGIFLFSVKAIIAAFTNLAPGMVAPVTKAVDGAKSDLGFLRLLPDSWSTIEDISIDYAIMEKAHNLAVMPYAKRWSDLGGWQAVWLESNPDEKGVVCSERASAIDCTDTLLRSEDEGLELVGIGLTNIVAVATSDAVVVADKSQAPRVREAVQSLKAKGAGQADAFLRDHRPWGWYEKLASGERFQVKRIVVKPGAALSLQSHHHRSEHWIVVAGTARVTIGDEEKLVTENQSVYIPLGTKHRLVNPGKVPMVLIEVQTGTYLGEDDILRYEDLYARSLTDLKDPCDCGKK